MPYTLEVCVDSTASALAAMQGGAHRLELCADLVIGGTTPSLALLQQVKAETGLPVRALLRPRFGDFCYDRWELAQMAQSAARLVEAGADGIVTGVLTPKGDLDVEALQPIYAAASAFRSGLATLTTPDGRVGMIDRTGRIVLPFCYSYISSASDGLIAAFDGAWRVYKIMEK